MYFSNEMKYKYKNIKINISKNNIYCNLYLLLYNKIKYKLQ